MTDALDEERVLRILRGPLTYARLEREILCLIREIREDAGVHPKVQSQDASPPHTKDS